MSDLFLELHTRAQIQDILSESETQLTEPDSVLVRVAGGLGSAMMSYDGFGQVDSSVLQEAFEQDGAHEETMIVRPDGQPLTLEELYTQNAIDAANVAIERRQSGRAVWVGNHRPAASQPKRPRN